MDTIKDGINQRFIDAIEHLKMVGKVKNIADFCRKTEISPYSIRDIKSRKQNVTNLMVGKIRNLFNVNPDWILLGNSPMFVDKQLVNTNFENEDSISERIESLIKALNMNTNSFAKALGYSNATIIYNITGGRGSLPTFPVLEKICQSFEQINAEWLITGKGSMFKSAGDGASSTEIMELKHRIQILEAEKEALFEKATLLKDTTTVYEKMLKIIERDQGKSEQRQAG